MAAQWGTVGMLLHSNYALFKVSGKQIWSMKEMEEEILNGHEM